MIFDSHQLKQQLFKTTSQLIKFWYSGSYQYLNYFEYDFFSIELFECLLYLFEWYWLFAWIYQQLCDE
jgi:hypothetical protein